MLNFANQFSTSILASSPIAVTLTVTLGTTTFGGTAYSTTLTVLPFDIIV